MLNYNANRHYRPEKCVILSKESPVVIILLLMVIVDGSITQTCKATFDGTLKVFILHTCNFVVHLIFLLIFLTTII